METLRPAVGDVENRPRSGRPGLQRGRAAVRVLEDAELVTTVKVGRTRRCSLGPRRLEDLERWIDEYRRMLDERLDRFGELLERTKGAQR